MLNREVRLSGIELCNAMYDLLVFSTIKLLQVATTVVLVQQ